MRHSRRLTGGTLAGSAWPALRTSPRTAQALPAPMIGIRLVDPCPRRGRPRRHRPRAVLALRLEQKCLSACDGRVVRLEARVGQGVQRLAGRPGVARHVFGLAPAPSAFSAILDVFDQWLPLLGRAAQSRPQNQTQCSRLRVKHHEMPTRSHTSKAELRASVERGFDSYRRPLLAKGEGQSRLAA